MTHTRANSLAHANGLATGFAGYALRRLRELLVPSVCLGCDNRVEQQGGLCPKCWNRLHFIEKPYCEVLGTAFSHDQGKGAISPLAIADPPPFDRLRSAVSYGDLARSLVTGLKFADRADLAPWMARWMLVAGRELIGDSDIIAAVPLHRTRLLTRRYNQSAELARAVAGASGIKFAPAALVRHKRTGSQVGLSASQRERNVQGAFRVPQTARPLIEEKRILLVDDVYTSGATAKACCRELLRAGAGAVDVLTFARVTDTSI